MGRFSAQKLRERPTKLTHSGQGSLWDLYYTAQQKIKQPVYL